MSQHDHSKEMQGRRSLFSLDNNDEGSAARTRPLSLEEIMCRRKNKEFPGNVKESLNETKTNLPKSVVVDVSHHFSSEKQCRESKNGHSSSMNTLKRSSRKKDERASMKEDCLDDNARENRVAKMKLISRSTKDKGSKRKGNEAEKIIYEKGKYGEMSSNDFRCGREEKDTKYSQARAKNVDQDRQKFEKDRKRKRYEDNDNCKEDIVEMRHEKHRNDMSKNNRDASNNYVKEADKKCSRHSASKDKYPDRSRGKPERESDRKHKNHSDTQWNVNVARKNDRDYHCESEPLERKERHERMKLHDEESRVKRGRSRSREHDERRKRSPSISLTAHSYHDEKLKESLPQSLKDRSRHQQSNTDKVRSSTNGSSSHHQKHTDFSSKLGGYSPRKRKPEASAKVLSPSSHSQQRKSAGWDLPPQGTESGFSSVVPPNFLFSHVPSSNTQQLASATIDSSLLKSLPVAIVSSSLKGINTSVDSVQLTQATRPMRRLYLENLPPSASEKAVIDFLNGFLLSTGINHIQGVQPCIGCTIHKEKGQALVEFLTPEDASAALSFDGSLMLGSILKIRRPKDYVEVSNSDSERSTEVALTISDIVQDSPDKVFVGGVSKQLSPEMLLEVASIFGSLKAFHFEASSADGPCAFMEYIDHSVTAKACAGLSGMKLAGKVLTVVQAMSNLSFSENDGREPCYNVPELAKPLLKEPTQILKLRNVFNAEALSSLTDQEVQEVLEDVRVECARFGTVKSINVVKHVNQIDHATNSETHEVANDVGMTGASLTSACGERSAQPGLVEEKYDQESRDTGKQLVGYAVEEPKDNCAQCNTVGATELSVQIAGEASCNAEHPEDHVTIGGTETEMTQDGNHQKSLNDEDDINGNNVSDVTGMDCGKTTEATITFNLIRADSDVRDCSPQPNGNVSGELAGVENGSEVEQNANHEDVFELGSVFVEYARTEACCMAAHCLHGRSFEHRIVVVEYVPLHVYRTRFTK